MAMYQNISRAVIRSRSASQPTVLCASYHQKVSKSEALIFVECFAKGFTLHNLKLAYVCVVGSHSKCLFFFITFFQVIDHYEKPRNVGSMDKKDVNVGTGLVGAPACGDVMKLQIKVDENGKIIDAKFKTFGCGSAIASSSLATEWVKGKSVSYDYILGKCNFFKHFV